MEAVATTPTNDPGSTIVRIGVDIGQMRDPTAIIVTEEVRRERVTHFLVHSIERVPLGTPYPVIVDRIVAVMDGLRAKDAQLRRDAPPREVPARRGRWGGGHVRPPAAGFGVQLLVDATGVGRPVIDLVKARGLRPIAVTLTGGDGLTEQDGDRVSMAKSYLVSRLQVLLQSGQLHLPDTEEARTLARELQDYRITVSDAGHASFNARSGQHDDLVISLGLSAGYEVARPTGMPVLSTRSRNVYGW